MQMLLVWILFFPSTSSVKGEKVQDVNCFYFICYVPYFLFTFIYIIFVFFSFCRCMDLEHYCLDDEWTCKNTLCIPLVKHCDGTMNCYDHSDEYNCGELAIICIICFFYKFLISLCCLTVSTCFSNFFLFFFIVH